MNNKQLTVLFPEIEPYDSGMLSLDALHTMYWEQSGNPKGVPVLFLHGGPGAGSTPAHRRFFDPDHYRIVIFDERGSGRSTPLGGIRDNTTPHLIHDIETLRQHLGIDKWLIFGGSWGSTLAAYLWLTGFRSCNAVSSSSNCMIQVMMVHVSVYSWLSQLTFCKRFFSIP